MEAAAGAERRRRSGAERGGAERLPLSASFALRVLRALKSHLDDVSCLFHENRARG